MKTLSKLILFFKKDIWHIKREDVSPFYYFCISILKKLFLAIEYFTTKRMVDTAAALTYSSLLAIVPILAVVFAIARGFGYNKYIETWFRDLLSSQPQAAEIIIGFVNSYLIHTKSGIFLGIGLLFMLWTVIMLINNIEKAFNNIWQVNQPRSIFRTFTDYLGMFLLMPIIIVVTSGLSIMIAGFADQTDAYYVVGPMMRTVLKLIPYVIMSAVFVALYVFMPNTKVDVKSAIAPGILAGVAMQGLQFIYIHSQIWVTGYNAIYGSFAALPLFMLWMQISWTICLFGAELCFTNQNLETYAFRAKTHDLSYRYRLLLSIHLMSLICKRYEQENKHYTALQLKLETKIPIRITNDLLNDLVHAKLLKESHKDEKGSEPEYLPNYTTNKMSVGSVIDRLEAKGRWVLPIGISSLTEGHPHWRQMIINRTNYLESQRELLLKDL